MFKTLISATEYIIPILDVALTPDRKDIQTRRFIGTGVFISKDTILTSKHVLQSAENSRCIVGNISKYNKNLQYTGLGFIKEHEFADIATAKIKEEYTGPFKHMEVAFNQEIASGRKVYNYSYVEAQHPDYRIPVIPRLNRGSIIRNSHDNDSQNVNYFEVNFPVFKGMFGSPVLDNDSGKIIGLICRNLLSHISEDSRQEENVNDNIEKESEETKAFNTIQFAKALNVSEYEDFIETSVNLKPSK